MHPTMLKTSRSMGSHASKFFWSFPIDKLIRYGVDFFTHSYLQGLYYSVTYIYTILKLKYEFTFYYIDHIYI
jgi:hypothetical protein